MKGVNNKAIAGELTALCHKGERRMYLFEKEGGGMG